jgi:hypothetical protein
MDLMEFRIIRGHSVKVNPRLAKRAYSATRLAERPWAKYFADNMFRWDQTVENTVLVEIAQALGHQSPNTTCRYYLDLGRDAYFKLGENLN